MPREISSIVDEVFAQDRPIRRSPRTPSTKISDIVASVFEDGEFVSIDEVMGADLSDVRPTKTWESDPVVAPPQPLRAQSTAIKDLIASVRAGEVAPRTPRAATSAPSGFVSIDEIMSADIDGDSNNSDANYAQQFEAHQPLNTDPGSWGEDNQALEAIRPAYMQDSALAPERVQSELQQPVDEARLFARKTALGSMPRYAGSTPQELDQLARQELQPGAYEQERLRAIDDAARMAAQQLYAGPATNFTGQEAAEFAARRDNYIKQQRQANLADPAAQRANAAQNRADAGREMQAAGEQEQAQGFGVSDYLMLSNPVTAPLVPIQKGIGRAIRGGVQAGTASLGSQTARVGDWLSRLRPDQVATMPPQIQALVAGAKTADALLETQDTSLQQEADLLKDTADLTSAQTRGAAGDTTLTRVLEGSARSFTQMAPAIASGGGAFANILLAAQSAASDADAEGRRQGLEGRDLAKHVIGQALVEGGVTAAFQRAGLGGLESALENPAARKTVGAILKDWVPELAEENSIQILQDFLRKDTLGPQAGIQQGELIQNLTDTSLQTLGMSGVTSAQSIAQMIKEEGPDAIREALRSNGSREMVRLLPKALQRKINQQTRSEALAELEKIVKEQPELLSTNPDERIGAQYAEPVQGVDTSRGVSAEQSDRDIAEHDASVRRNYTPQFRSPVNEFEDVPDATPTDETREVENRAAMIQAAKRMGHSASAAEKIIDAVMSGEREAPKPVREAARKNRDARRAELEAGMQAEPLGDPMRSAVQPTLRDQSAHKGNLLGVPDSELGDDQRPRQPLPEESASQVGNTAGHPYQTRTGALPYEHLDNAIASAKEAFKAGREITKNQIAQQFGLTREQAGGVLVEAKTQALQRNGYSRKAAERIAKQGLAKDEMSSESGSFAVAKMRAERDAGELVAAEEFGNRSNEAIRAAEEEQLSRRGVEKLSPQEAEQEYISERAARAIEEAGRELGHTDRRASGAVAKIVYDQDKTRFDFKKLREKDIKDLNGDESKWLVGRSELTGLRNKKWYVSAERQGSSPYKASIDVNGLKQINDRFGHEAGDALVEAAGDVVREIADLDVYHFSGDEFVARGSDEKSFSSAMKQLEDKLLKRKVYFKDSKGREYFLDGIRLGYGVAPTMAQAEEELKNDKATQERLGKRELRSSWEQRFKSDPAALPRHIVPVGGGLTSRSPRGRDSASGQDRGRGRENLLSPQESQVSERETESGIQPKGGFSSLGKTSLAVSERAQLPRALKGDGVAPLDVDSGAQRQPRAQSGESGAEADDKQYLESGAAPSPQTPSGKVAKGISRYRDVIPAIQRELLGRVPLDIGKMPKPNIRGYFKRYEEIVRVRGADAGSLHVVSHEAAHNLDEQYKAVPSAPDYVKSELAKMDYSPELGRPSEGFAEWIYDYFSSDGKRNETVKAWFENEFLPKHAELQKSVQKIKSLVEGYQSQDVEEQARQDRSKTGKAPKFRALAETLRHIDSQVSKFFSDRIGAIEKAEHAAERQNGEQITGTERSVHRYLEAMTGSASPRGMDAFENGVTSLVTGKRPGPGMREVYETLGSVSDDRIASLYNYAEALRTLDHQRRAMATAMSAENAKAIVARYAQDQAMRQAHTLLVLHSKANVEMLREAGAIAPGEADAILRSEPNYVPFKRVQDGDLVERAVTRLGGHSIKELQGSGRQIKDIAGAILENDIRAIDAAIRAQAVQKLIDLTRDSKGLGWLAHEIEPSESGKASVLTVWRDGQRRAYRVDPDVFDALLNVNVPRLPKFLQSVGKVAEIASTARRLGATALRPGFQLVNWARDKQAGVIRTEGDPGKFLARSFVADVALAADAVRSVAGAGHKNPMLVLAKKLGVEMYGAGTQFEDMHREASELVEQMQGNLLRRATRQAMRRPLQTITELIGFPEMAPRIVEMQHVLERNGYTLDDVRNGKPLPQRVQVELALAGRNITLNFSRGGVLTKAYNPFKAFINVAAQGPIQALRHSGAKGLDPRNWDKSAIGRTAFRGTAFLTLPAIALFFKNKDEDWYKRLPAYRRMFFWNITEGISIPRLDVYGAVFAGIPEMLLNQLYGTDPKATERMLDELGGKDITYLAPDVLEPLLHLDRNKDWRGKPIVSRDIEKLEAKDQHTPFTSGFAKWLGEMTDIAPVKLDYAIKSYSGGLGGDILKTPEEGVSGVLGLKRFEPRERSRSIEDFYDEFEKIDRKYNSAQRSESMTKELAVQHAKLSKARALMSGIGKVSREWPEDQKTEAQRFIGGVADAALGLEPLDRYPNPITAKDLPPEIEDVVIEHLGTLVNPLVRLEGNIDLTAEDRRKGKTIQTKRAEFREKQAAAKEAVKGVPLDRLKQAARKAALRGGASVRAAEGAAYRLEEVLRH